MVTPESRTLTRADEIRLCAGLAIQPFLAAGLTLVVYPLVFPDRQPPANVHRWLAALAKALYFGVAALVITIACALPTVVWLVRRRPVPLTLALIFGLAFSNVPVLFATAGGGGGGFRLHTFASVLGLLGAAAFWFISVRGRDFRRDSAAA